MPVEGDDCWNGVGGVGDVGRWEDGWGDGDEGSSSSELCGMGRGEAARREDMRGGADEGSSGQVGGMSG